MKKILFLLICICCSVVPSGASSMFDNDGNYSGNWKQMTNVKTGNSGYKNSDFYSSTWYSQQNKKKNSRDYTETVSTNRNDVTPFRYNTLNYTRVRNMQGSDGIFKSKCTDIGDASFCN